MNSFRVMFLSTRNISIWTRYTIIQNNNVYVNILPLKFQVGYQFASSLSNENSELVDPCILQPVSKSSSTALRVKKISKAMKAYLERAKNHSTFLTSKNEEFEIGKHHLANIMGLEVGTLTQEDIDKAICYLLPSGLYEPKARPLMKPPEILFPKEKAAQFDVSGRPFNPFFYTLRANFYSTMHEIVGKFKELDDFEDKMLRKSIATPPEEYHIDLSGGQWLTIDELRNIFIEQISETEYDFMISTLERLAGHPYAFQCKDYIWKFRKDFVDVSSLETVPELMYDDTGRPYMETEGSKKTSKSKVRVWGNGTGQIDICGRGINYFHRLEDRQQVMFPLEMSGLLGKVDVKATVESGGVASQAGAIRYALSMCLRCFVSEEIRERMRLAGLLTRDRRTRERKKPGQKGARAKYKWLKR